MLNDKKSRLVFDAKMTRKLLKMNGQIKYCPFCGAAINAGCGCHKNFLIDIKKKRDTENESVFIFENNASFQADYEELIEASKANDVEEE